MSKLDKSIIKSSNRFKKDILKKKILKLDIFLIKLLDLLMVVELKK